MNSKTILELEIGDIVVTCRGDNYNFLLYLGTTSVNNRCFYFIDTIFKGMYYKKEALAFRVNFLNQQIKDFILTDKAKASYFTYHNHIVNYTVIEHYDKDAVMNWYMKNRMMNKDLPELYTQQEVNSMMSKRKAEIKPEKTFGNMKKELGMTFTTNERRIYYVYLGVTNWFVKIKAKNMRDFRDGLLTSPYCFDYNPVVNFKRANHLVYAGEAYDKTFLRSFLSYIPNL